MFTIYKLIDGVETEVRCTTQEGAEAMVTIIEMLDLYSEMEK